MKIKLNQNKLSKAFQYASRAVSQKPNIPILSNLLLDISDDSLKISATNLDMGIKMWIPGSMEKAGKVTVNAKYIADFVSATSTTTENIEIEQKENNVVVNTAKSKASFTVIPADEFPVLPAAGEKVIFKISTVEFIASMEKVLFACSTDLTAGRIQQSGVLFDIDNVNSEVHFVGLDGFRLSRRISQIKELDKDLEKEEIIVPAKYLSEMVKILQNYPEVEDLEVYLSESGSQIIFKFDDIEFSIRLLEGPYPDYKRIMPDSSSFDFEVKKSELENSIKIVNSFARGNLGNKTLFDLDAETSSVMLKSAVTDVGEGETKIQVSNLEAESDLKTAYTLRYLQDLVNHTSGDSLLYETKGPLAATVFRDKEDSQFLHIIMPMRREN